jgi:hypothetical protein
MTEVLAILAVVILLVVVFVPSVVGCGGHQKAPSIRCVNNLKNVGLAFRIFATDNHDQFPHTLMASNGVNLAAMDILTVYKNLSNELSTPRLLHCPADTRRTAADNFTDFTRDDLSYFVNLSSDETRPGTFLGGDRNLELNGKPVPPGLLTLSSNMPLGFTEEMHNQQGHILMSDGSVQQMSSRRLPAAIGDQELGTNYLVIP